ncbi:hypothetical protein GE061_017860 [Apolygus lucorum]|uniref:Uncharacterized protein n=1 Tax=Apolygus lucorum TaxID=248454 RepID=A0A8S9XDL6_APOLU|nr:hypothetical protein GE061_017860 [Apolygus lucorum]
MMLPPSTLPFAASGNVSSRGRDVALWEGVFSIDPHSPAVVHEYEPPAAISLGVLSEELLGRAVRLVSRGRKWVRAQWREAPVGLLFGRHPPPASDASRALRPDPRWRGRRCRGEPEKWTVVSLKEFPTKTLDNSGVSSPGK